MDKQMVLDNLPICDMGQLSKEEKRFLNNQARKGNIIKTKRSWSNLVYCLKTWYLPKN